jgi:hypothetical protein
MRDGSVSIADPRTWFVLALAAGLALIGVLLIAAPRLSAALFGIPAPEGVSLLYLPVLGTRDLAVAGYLVALVRLGDRQALAALCGITALLPVADLIIVGLARGFSGWPHLLLHAASGVAFALAFVWLKQPTTPEDQRP